MLAKKLANRYCLLMEKNLLNKAWDRGTHFLLMLILISFCALTWFLVFAAFAKIADAETLKPMIVRFVVLDGPYALTGAEERLVEANAERKWRRIGYRFKKHATLRLPFFSVNPKVEDIGPTFDAMRTFVISQLGGARYRFTHIISPPLVDVSKELVMAGRAERIGGNYAWSVGESRNSWNENRLPHSAVAVAHEIGHLAGMLHDSSNPPNIMNPAALQFVDAFPDMSFSRWNRKQINLRGNP